MKSSKVSIKTRSTPASLSFKGQATKHTTVKWSIGGFQVDLAGGSLPLIIRLELKQNPFSFESRYRICLHVMENNFAHQ